MNQWLRNALELRILLFEKGLSHPSCFIWMIVKPTCNWVLFTKAAWVLWLSNNEKILFLWTICIAGKAECHSKLAFLVSTHLLLWESTIRWSKCEEGWFINIPAIFRPKSGQNFPYTGSFLFHSPNVHRSCFSVSSDLLEPVPTQILVTIWPVQSTKFTHTWQNDWIHPVPESLSSSGTLNASSNTAHFAMSIPLLTISHLFSICLTHIHNPQSTSGLVMMHGHLLDNALGFECTCASISGWCCSLQDSVDWVNFNAPSGFVAK